MEIGIQVKMKSEFIAIARNDVNQGDELKQHYHSTKDFHPQQSNNLMKMMTIILE